MRRTWLVLVVLSACFTRPQRPPDSTDGGSNASDGGGEAPPALGSDIIAMAAGDHHVCAITKGAQVVCWGDDRRGQLGDGSATPTGTPIVVTPASGAVEIAAGTSHTCALVGSNVLCWGDGTFGQTANSNTQVHAVDLSSLGTSFGIPVHLFAGGNATCVITDVGNAGCWGDIDDTASEFTLPEPINPGSGAPWTMFALSSEQSCALGSGGIAYCWGNNSQQQLGASGSARSLATASTVPGRFDEISVMSGATFARDGGNLLGWGDVHFTGGSGSAAPSIVSGPASTATDHASWDRVVTGRHHICGVFAGSVACFGPDDFGAIGSFEPILAAAGRHELGTGSDVVAGLGFTCLLDGGTVSCAGANMWGELGNGDIASAHVPKKVAGVTVTSDAAITAGSAHTCVTTGSGMTCWGNDTANQVSGTGSVGSAVAMPTPTTFTTAIIALAAGASHTCALDILGRVHCIGDTRGFGTIESGSGSASSLAAGDFATCDIINGAATCYGTGIPGGFVSPATITVTNTRTIAVGTNLGMDITTSDNELTAFGSECTPDIVMQLGTGSNTQSAQVAQGTHNLPAPACFLTAQAKLFCLVPGTCSAIGATRIGSLTGQTFGSFAIGGFHGCALDAGGNSRTCFGDNSDASFGIATAPEISNGSAATASDIAFTKLAAGPHHTCGIDGGGNVYCWGLNRSGEIGDGKHAQLVPQPVIAPR